MNGKLRNIGPKSAAWLRQVGLRSREDLAAIGSAAAFVKVRRAGFKPSLNLLYSLEGALLDCHWQEVPEARRSALASVVEEAIAALPAPRGRPVAAPVSVIHHEDTTAPSPSLFDDERSAPSDD